MKHMGSASDKHRKYTRHSGLTAKAPENNMLVGTDTNTHMRNSTIQAWGNRIIMRQALEQKKSKGRTREKKRQQRWILKLVVLFGPPLTFGTLTYAKPERAYAQLAQNSQIRAIPKVAFRDHFETH